MNNRKKSQHIIILIIFLSTLASSNSQSTLHKTQRLTESNEILELVVSTLNQTISKVNESSSNFSHFLNLLGPDLTHHDRCAFEDCLELLDDTIYNLKTAISKLQSTSSQEVNMLLSDAMTNQDTCLDGLTTSGNQKINGNGLSESILSISNDLSKSLDMLQKINGFYSEELDEVDVEFPSWVLENDQRVLQAPVKETKFNLTVAKDGTGNFTTINEAVSAAPNSSVTRFVIYIKSGEYFENVDIIKKKTKIMFVGDGIGKTIIKANRSYTVDGSGWPTFRTATVGVRGEGFIAKDITFINSAGLTKNQSVALRSGSNHSAFYRCSFEGYQDTLYVHSSRQFYRECKIYGTIDFIFGNAAVVFQNCSLYARKPRPHQSIVFTAQGRENWTQTTGISIINCSFLAAEDLRPFKGEFKAYLGRPWRNHSRVVVMKSFIDDLIDPAGWLRMGNEFGVENLYYGEYMNEGPGANMTGRVKWPSFRRIETVKEAAQFTVGPFIDAKTWLNSTNIPYSLGF